MMTWKEILNDSAKWDNLGECGCSSNKYISYHRRGTLWVLKRYYKSNPMRFKLIHRGYTKETWPIDKLEQSLINNNIL